MKKITRNQINKENMVTLGYCQCQKILNLFAYDYKVGYNAGVYGWNYDLYNIHGVDIVTGYNVPYASYSNENVKNKLVALENKVIKTELIERENLKKEFFDIFE